MQRLFIEAPCFGFGPISTSISIAKKLNNKYEIVFISYGEALNYLEECTDYKYLEIDTRHEEYFSDLISHISLDDLIIVNTNVEFSTFLLKLGYKVLVIDTLYWMWNAVSEEYKRNNNCIVQVYYSEGIGKLPPREECKPIIDYDVWKKNDVPQSNSALISFGGMAEPGYPDFILEFSQWMIEKIISNLPQYVKNVYIVGGLFNKKRYEQNNKCINILGTINKYQFKELVDKCKYIFLSPGLTSLYEMLSNERLFCLLPGLNVSQIYQIFHFYYSCHYPHCIMWAESKELVEKFSKLPELEGLSYLKDYLTNQVIKEHIDFERIITKYINSVNNKEFTVNKEVMNNIFNHKSVDELVEIYLERMVNE